MSAGVSFSSSTATLSLSAQPTSAGKWSQPALPKPTCWRLALSPFQA